MRIRLHLEDTTLDTLGMMMVGYVLNMPKNEAKYQEKVQSVVEFLEEIIEVDFNTVACYIEVLNLMPETVKRRMPFRIQEFIGMYSSQIAEVLGGEVPAKYMPNKKILLV